VYWHQFDQITRHHSRLHSLGEAHKRMDSLKKEKIKESSLSIEFSARVVAFA
jgi:hypothetical protein